MNRPVATLLAAAVIVSMALASCTMGPPPSGHPIAGGSPSQTCAQCHSEIYDEWRRSAHASAYTRKEFQLAAGQHKETDCLRCHVPASLDTLTSQPVRTGQLDEGVNCESCHLTGGAYAAPKLFSPYANHEMVERPELATSEFCGRCHEAIFKQWSAIVVQDAETDKDKKTCQDCHMPTVRRKTVSGSFWHLLHPEADVRRHGFAMVRPPAGRKNVTVQVALETASARRVAGTVTLTNVSAHHSLPSGQFGFRELAVVVTLTDRYGAASAKRVVRFLAQKKNYLEYRKPRVVDFAFDTVARDVESVEIRLVRSSFDGVRAVLHHEKYPLRTGKPAAGAKEMSQQ